MTIAPMGKDTFVNSGDTDPFEARVGATLAGKWTLVRLIGVGGMASVYEARHEIGRREAIKILHPEIARQDELRKRFEQEAYAVNRLDHPGVVQIRDTGITDDGCPFLVMELLDGKSLADCLLERTLSADAALGHVDELLDVLALAHHEGIIHRDLKPDNLFITASGKLKVLDFGIARVRASSAMKVVTQAGTALGTPNYMPPEQIKGVDVDHRADIFAVGAILWEMLTGRDLHDASSTQELMLKMLTTPAPPILSVAPHVGEPIALVVDRALAFEALDRYPDARTMQQDLREARSGRPPPFAIAPPAAIHDRSTVARTPQAIAPTRHDDAMSGPVSHVPVSHVPVSHVPVSHVHASHVPVSYAAMSSPLPSGDPPLSHAPAQSVALSPAKKQGEHKLIVAIVVLGTLVGALATVIVLRTSGAATESTEEPEDDDGGKSQTRATDDDDERSARPVAPSGSGSAALPEPGDGGAAPVPVGPSSNPSGPVPPATDPDPTDPPGPEPPSPEPPSPEPPSPEPPSPEPPSPEPPSVDPRPVPTPPKPKPQGPPPVGKKRKKKDRGKGQGKGHDDDD